MRVTSRPSHFVPLSLQVSGHYREDRLRPGARADPLPPVESAPRRVVLLDVALPAATGARLPEETRPQSVLLAAGIVHTQLNLFLLLLLLVKYIF